LDASKIKDGIKRQKFANVSADRLESMGYVISAAVRGSLTEGDANACRDFWETGKYAGRIQNLPMRHWD
jgi:hypothetical protein